MVEEHSMTREPGEPQTTLSLTPGGVNVAIQIFFKGDETDWHPETLSAWLLELSEKVRAIAEVHAAYGLLTPTPVLPELVAPVLPRVEKPALEALIERGVQQGTLLPVTPRPSTAHWKQQALEILRARDGIPSVELLVLDPSLTRNAVQQRLYQMRDKGLIEFRHTGGAPTHGMWYARPMEPDQPSVDLVTSVLPYSRGKRWLMLGGRPNTVSKGDLEKQLSLAELRWPELEENAPIEWSLREIRKSDVDLVIVNRFNRKRSNQFMHVAQEAGKPYLYLMRGYGVRTVASEVRTQILDARRDVPQLQIAA
jgi:hypothetical protein